MLLLIKCKISIGNTIYWSSYTPSIVLVLHVQIICYTTIFVSSLFIPLASRPGCHVHTHSFPWRLLSINLCNCWLFNHGVPVCAVIWNESMIQKLLDSSQIPRQSYGIFNTYCNYFKGYQDCTVITEYAVTNKKK